MTGRLVVLLSSIIEQSLQQSVTWTQHDVSRLRKHLLVDTYLDSLVPPVPRGDGGLELQLQFRIFKIIAVDLATANLKLLVWRRTQWYDSRLSWNESEWNGVTEFRAQPGLASGGEADGPDNNIVSEHRLEPTRSHQCPH